MTHSSNDPQLLIKPFVEGADTGLSLANRLEVLLDEMFPDDTYIQGIVVALASYRFQTHAPPQTASLCRYSITTSARPSSVGGIVRPIAFAVLRLIANSNVVGCSIGISLGFAPPTILLT
jgi:hypothetical protein